MNMNERIPLEECLNNLSVNQNLWTHGGISCRAFF